MSQKRWLLSNPEAQDQIKVVWQKKDFPARAAGGRQRGFLQDRGSHPGVTETVCPAGGTHAARDQAQEARAPQASRSLAHCWSGRLGTRPTHTEVASGQWGEHCVCEGTRQGWQPASHAQSARCAPCDLRVCRLIHPTVTCQSGAVAVPCPRRGNRGTQQCNLPRVALLVAESRFKPQLSSQHPVLLITTVSCFYTLRAPRLGPDHEITLTFNLTRKQTICKAFIVLLPLLCSLPHVPPSVSQQAVAWKHTGALRVQLFSRSAGQLRWHHLGAQCGLLTTGGPSLHIQSGDKGIFALAGAAQWFEGRPTAEGSRLPLQSRACTWAAGSIPSPGKGSSGGNRSHQGSSSPPSLPL